MTELDRRNFLKMSALLGLGSTALVSSLAACSSQENEFNLESLAVARVSSDPYKTGLQQRFAFSIFEATEIVSDGNLQAKIISPAGKETTFDEIALRDQGIPDQGIYSFNHGFNEEGFWKLETTFASQDLTLDFQVFGSPAAPGLAQVVPSVATPTTANPLDASVLCTRFEGNCEFHNSSVDKLLESKAPFVVLFATPARCQTTYCGPVLELTRRVAPSFDIETIHIEIYKDETSDDVLDAVTTWNLPSEPWLFGVNGKGEVVARLDGAFDQSEIQELFEAIT